MKYITLKITDENGEPRRAVLVPTNGGFVATGDASRYQIREALRGLVKPGTPIKIEKKEK
jgi:hypothetical protein